MSEDFIKGFFPRANSFERVQEFAQKRNLNLFTKFRRDRNPINVYAWMSEVKFGQILNPFCQHMRYGPALENKKTPDWVIEMNEQIIIAEVLRLNTTEEEMLAEIKWEKHVEEYNKLHPTTPIVGHSKSFSGSCEFLYGHQSKIEKKETSYGPYATERNIPFIICIESTIDTYIWDRDMRDFLEGKWGLFQTNKNFEKNVTGVLFMDCFGVKTFYSNPNCQVKLNESNMQAFRQMESNLD